MIIDAHVHLISEEELQQCLYRTAKDFFNLPIDD